LQYRDHKNHEVDFIIEKEGEGILGIEVKASSKVTRSDFSPQIWFKESILKGKTPYTGLLMYSGEHTLSFGDGLYAVPVAALWTV
jgi:predicted AAA+ superfamily ATPase